MGNNDIFFFFLLALLLPLHVSSQNASSTRPPHNISAVFAFGDSTLDPGNNNALLTLFKADHPPYGRDFPSHVASGRFTNGRLPTDYLVSMLGIKSELPAYLNKRVSNQDLLTGVSFASAGTGLDNFPATVINVLPMNTQLRHFRRCLGRIQRRFGLQRANQVVGNALFTISAGTDDLIWNFYGLPGTRTLQFSISGYQDFLLRNLETFVERLHSMGARKLSITGLPPIGCLPFQITAGSFMPSPHMFQRVCVTQQNTDSHAYNTKLQSLIDRLQTTLPGVKIAYVDIYNPLMDMITNPGRYGFLETTRGCCGTGTMEMGPLCNGVIPTCPDASRYVFWDAVHPTQATYQVLAHIYETTVLPLLTRS
ncbi:hypothetical protein GIB67_036706 [Kingdonia uniflora]|uniref:Uncharacterized protein n=1 Tax=Kingdonia uniflora TaxID=39325 RepID=A0A7J7LWM0_9MAGN|nr:hypothetical protein GIB67_036706 [Kingdonia uniflora]